MDVSTEAKAIGIDLGTSKSCVGVFQNGRVEIIPNEFGNLTTPSYVAFTETQRHVGDAAKSQVVMNPENTIFNAKRLIGRDLNDKKITQDMAQWPFKVVNVEGKPHFEVEFKGEEKRFCPEEICSLVLIKMKESAEAYLGQKVRDAVISVPAYFNNSQRTATKDAATIAGLNALLINDTTAAALAYGFDKKLKDEKNILVFDLGGGTLDVSIVNINKGYSFEVKATSGDAHLGGEDFDNRLVTHFCEEFKRKYHKDITTSPRALRRLKTGCEWAKITLSSTFEAYMEIIHDGVELLTKISRTEFEELNMELFRSILNPVKKVLKDAKIDKSKLDEVILVGGSTRIPKIRELLQEFFYGNNANGRKELNKTINPDEAVAYGAAIRAAIMLRRKPFEIPRCLLQENYVTDVAPFSLWFKTSYDFRKKIIYRNSRIPCIHSNIFTTCTDDHPSVTVQVFEGTAHLFARNSNLLGTFCLTGIVPTPQDRPEIKVDFAIDRNGILTVSAKARTSGKSNKATNKNTNGCLNTGEMNRMLAEAEMYSQEEVIQKERAKARNQFEAYVFEVKEGVEKGLSTGVEYSRDVLSKCQQALNWLDSNWLAEKEEYNFNFKEFKNDCEELGMKFHGEGSQGPSDGCMH